MKKLFEILVVLAVIAVVTMGLVRLGRCDDPPPTMYGYVFYVLIVTPVPECSVFFEHDTQGLLDVAITDEEGYYTPTWELPAGNYDVWAEQGARKSQVEEVTFDGHSPTPVDTLWVEPL